MDRLTTGFAVALAAVVGFVGCGQTGPAVQYVEGVVTLDGSPLEGATVGFSPVDAAKGTAAVGTTDSRGVFKLTAVQGGKPDGGAVAGEYQVTFQKSSVKVLSKEETEKLQKDPNYGKATSGRPETPTFKSLVPPAYGAPATSGFRVTVKEGKNVGDPFKFDLKSSYQGPAKP